jgi:hypothetical protein
VIDWNIILVPTGMMYNRQYYIFREILSDIFIGLMQFQIDMSQVKNNICNVKSNKRRY